MIVGSHEVTLIVSIELLFLIHLDPVKLSWVRDCCYCCRENQNEGVAVQSIFHRKVMSFVLLYFKSLCYYNVCYYVMRWIHGICFIL